LLVAKKEIYSYLDEPKKQPIRNRKKNTRSNFAMKVKLITSAIMILCICLFVLLRYAYMTEIEFEVTQLNKEIETLNNKKQSLTFELDVIKSSGLIEAEAQNKLGMVYPSDQQIVYLSVEDNNDENAFDDAYEKHSLVLLESLNNFLVKISNMF